MERRIVIKRIGLLSLAVASGRGLAGCGSAGDGNAANVAGSAAAGSGLEAGPAERARFDPKSVDLSGLPERLFADNRLVLTEPMLQHPTETTVRVVWFTEFEGRDHAVRYGAQLEQLALATTMKMSRLYEDQASAAAGRHYPGLTRRDIWRHEALVSELRPGQRTPYVALSNDGDGLLRSAPWSLQALPVAAGPEGDHYYAQRIGDVFLIALDANRIWRGWGPNARGKFTELNEAINDPQRWGFGDFQFWPFAKGSTQYQWLETTLASEACRSARYRIVMAHQSIFGLGDNATPVMAQTQASFEYDDGTGGRQVLGPLPFPISPERWQAEIQPIIDAGRMRFVKYDYPLAEDIWNSDIEPLLLAADVHLVHVGHSHLWCRSRVGGLNYLETSNVGNSYGGYVAEASPRRSQPPTSAQIAEFTSLTWDPDDYPAEGDPHDREMTQPSLHNPMAELDGKAALPFVASNDITVWTVFDTATGLVSSYACDTREPASQPLRFDEFRLG